MLATFCGSAARTLTVTGAFASGSTGECENAVKVARNYLLATIIESLGEAFSLIEKAGVDPEVFFDIITSTSMNSPAYKNYGRMMLKNPDNPGFSLKLGLKDVELALQTANDLGVPLPTASLIRDQHVKAIAHGYGEREWAALGTYLMDSAAGRNNGKSDGQSNSPQ